MKALTPLPAPALVAGLLLLFAGCGPATAQTNPAPARTAPAASDTAEATARNDTVPVVLVVSGGSSQGSYQGGVNWALIEFFRRTAAEPGFAAALGVPPHQLVATTGASAGSINSIASVLEWCRAGAPRAPEHSFYWKLWVRTGFEQLFSDDPRQGTRPEALFHRAYFDTVHLDEFIARSRAPQRPGCTGPAGIALGISLTRLQAEAVPLGRIEVATQRFATAIAAHVETGDGAPRMAFRQPGAAIRADPSFGRLIALPPDPAGRVADETVFAAAEASSAFPLAFPPRLLEFYRFDELSPDGSCPPAADGRCRNPEREHFIDGGVFDNSPLDLALGLLRQLRGDPSGSGSPDPLLVLIEPDFHRDPLRGARLAQRPAASPAEGMDALVLLAKNIVPAARQYELYALTRTLARDPSYGRPDWIHVTDRAFPVIGEHLQKFAAFLGKPFREFDFHAGMYDGFHFVAREVVCRPRARLERAGSGSDVVDDDAVRQRAECTVNTLRELIEGRHLEVGEIAPVVMAELFAAEYPDAPPPSVRVRPLDDDRLRLMAALTRANLARLSSTGSEQCGPRRNLAERILCTDGFHAILRELARPDVRAILEKWADEPGCGVGAVRPPDSCGADRTLVELVRDPERFVHRTVQRLIHQAWRVEVERSGVENHAALLQLLELAYGSTGSRYVRGIELDPSSIPDRARGGWRAMRLLPHYLGGTLGAPGVEIGYRPAIHLGDRFALVIPIIPVQHNSTRAGVPHRAYLGFGLGLGYKHDGLFFGGADVALQAMQPWSDVSAGSADAALGVETAAYVLGGKMRLSLRALPANTTAVHGGRRWAATVGIADFNGLLYWLLR